MEMTLHPEHLRAKIEIFEKGDHISNKKFFSVNHFFYNTQNKK